MFGELAVVNPPDVDRPHLDRPAGRGNAVERPVVRGSVSEAPGHPVTGLDEVVHGGGEIGEGGEEGGPEGAVGFAAILDEGIVVNVADGHEALNGVGVVLVEHGQVALSELLVVSGHGEVPSLI